MTDTKRIKNDGFVGMRLGTKLLARLDARVKEEKLATGSGSRSALIRKAIIEFLS